MNVYHYNVKKPGSSMFMLSVAANSRKQADVQVEELYKKDENGILFIDQEPGSLEDYVGSMSMARIAKKKVLMEAIANDKLKARKRVLHLTDEE